MDGDDDIILLASTMAVAATAAHTQSQIHTTNRLFFVVSRTASINSRSSWRVQLAVKQETSIARWIYIVSPKLHRPRPFVFGQSQTSVLPESKNQNPDFIKPYLIVQILFLTEHGLKCIREHFLQKVDALFQSCLLQNVWHFKNFWKYHSKIQFSGIFLVALALQLDVFCDLY